MHTPLNYAAIYLTDTFRSQEDLERDVRDYPVSSAARFLLLYQLKKNKDSHFDEVAKQTGIYLHNPSWMEFQLAEISTDNGNGNDIENNLAEPVSAEANYMAETNETNQDFVVADFLPVESDKELPEPVNEEIIENPVLENENSIDGNTENEEPIISNENEDEVIVEKPTDEELPEPVNGEIIENPVLENENSMDQNIEEEEPIISNENEEKVIEEKPTDEELPEPVNEEIIENPVLENENIIEQNSENEEPIISNENEDEVEVIVEKPTGEELPEPINEEIIENPVLGNENIIDGNTEKEEPIISNENKAEVIAEKQTEGELPGPVNEGIVENSDLEEENISFEPLHTVDYFASQGIKLSEEALNNDQLGRQVKSFTAWLKSMKKLHPGQLPEQNEVIEKLIQTSSEASNQNANVLTEAMAEVLVKQGKNEKAIEMYQKLSLINPSKSAYFAAKIESLKII